MIDQLQDPLTDVVSRFIAAEGALDGLRVRQSELREAAAQLSEATTTMDQRTVSSVDALEAIRADLRRKLHEEHEYATRQAALDGDIADVLNEFELVLEQLRAIDPARLTRDLSEIRRDGADNASELREVRRLVDGIERGQGQMSASVDSRGAAIDAAVHGLRTDAADRFDSLDRAIASIVRTSKAAVGLWVVTLAAVITSLLV